jgi:hypothetical protein
MPELTLSPSQGVRIWPQDSTCPDSQSDEDKRKGPQHNSAFLKSWNINIQRLKNINFKNLYIF